MTETSVGKILEIGDVTKDLALKLIELWQLNMQTFNIPSVLLKDAEAFIPEKMFVRPFLASANKIASDALWDNKPGAAFKALMKYGLENKRDKYREDARSGGGLMTTVRRNRRLAQSHWEASKPSNWNVCK